MDPYSLGFPSGQRNKTILAMDDCHKTTRDEPPPNYDQIFANKFNTLY